MAGMAGGKSSFRHQLSGYVFAEAIVGALLNREAWLFRGSRPEGPLLMSLAPERSALGKQRLEQICALREVALT